MLGRFGGDPGPGDAWGPQRGDQQPGGPLEAPHGGGSVGVTAAGLQLPGLSPLPPRAPGLLPARGHGPGKPLKGSALPNCSLLVGFLITTSVSCCFPSAAPAPRAVGSQTVSQVGPSVLENRPLLWGRSERVTLRAQRPVSRLRWRQRAGRCSAVRPSPASLVPRVCTDPNPRAPSVLSVCLSSSRGLSRCCRIC